MKQLIFILALFSFIAQPITITINFLSDIDYELVNIELDEKEKLENDSKDKENEINELSSHSHIINIYQITNYRDDSFLYHNIYAEVHIPPPDIS